MCGGLGKCQAQMELEVACSPLVFPRLSVSACSQYALLMFAAVVHETLPRWCGDRTKVMHIVLLLVHGP